ncbi:hypothetical protein KKC88_04060 [Patescibacteria group bacterium]|nr:hypothetical protein [Patescibacteria group bacterium]MBU1672987.1 hypothetical protein [Patescibacteria group bacterium]MBU1962978.1 hypothetical protein [Patescibacteria group bacterium]
MNIKNDNQGYVAMIIVLIITAVALVIAISISLSGISEVQMSFSQTQSDKAYSFSDACVEESLNKLKSNWVDMSGSLPFNDGDCTYDVFVGYGTGAEGSITVNSGTTSFSDNVKRPLADGTYGVGQADPRTVTISTAHGEGSFSTDDSVLLIQMGDNAIAQNKTGQYEYGYIDTISGNDITFVGNLSNTYTQDSLGDDRTQILKVPQYDNVTIDNAGILTGDPWDGYTGGVVAFNAFNTLAFNGTGLVDASEIGYRGGGCGSCGNNTWGQCGEGITGIGSGGGATAPDNYTGYQVHPDTGSNGGAGGYGPAFYGGSPGGGGSNDTSGTAGTSIQGEGADPGNVISHSLEDKLIFGGAGGGGGDNDNAIPIPIGGYGGGIILIRANTITNANISTVGGDAIAATSSGAGAVSGAGAGGDIRLLMGTLSTSAIDVSGGNGVTYNDDTGGDGGDGLYGTTTLSGNAIIEAIGTVTDETRSYTRKIRVEVDSSFNIVSWEEI